MSKRGRPKLIESPTKGFLLEAAAQLFRQHGFKKVSVEEICHKAGASKMSFYRHFNDKTKIALVTLEAFFSAELAWADELLLTKLSFMEMLNELLLRREQNHHKLGLLFLTEFHEVDSPEVNAFGQKWQKLIDQANLKFLSHGQKTGTISEDIEPKIFLFLIKKRNELLMDQELIKIMPTFKRRFKIVNELFYYGIGRRK